MWKKNFFEIFWNNWVSKQNLQNSWNFWKFRKKIFFCKFLNVMGLETKLTEFMRFIKNQENFFLHFLKIWGLEMKMTEFIKFIKILKKNFSILKIRRHVFEFFFLKIKQKTFFQNFWIFKIFKINFIIEIIFEIFEIFKNLEIWILTLFFGYTTTEK